MSARRPKDEAFRLFAERRFDRAAELFERLMQQDKADPVLRLQHAESCRRLGLTEKAINSYREAAERLCALGLYVRAKEAVKSALDLAPGDLALLRMMDEVAQPPRPAAPPLARPPRPSARRPAPRPRAKTRSEMPVVGGPRPVFTPAGGAASVPAPAAPPLPVGRFAYLLAGTVVPAPHVPEDEDLKATDPTVPVLPRD